ncbi:MAG: Ig-like domain-containing protein, partial [Rubripirellula sp.]
MLRILNNLVAALVKAWGWYCPNDEATPRRLQTQLKVIPLEARRVLNADGFTSEILSLGESEFAMPAQEALNETHTEHQASDAVAKFTNSKHQEADKLAPTNEIVFLDSSIENYHLLETSLSENFNLVLLKSHEDATQTIIHSLDRKHGLDAIHVLTHGAPGSISLGSHQLTSETLGQHAELLTSLRDTLSDSGDIFIYGCDVAQGEIGEAFTSALANATGADVSASIDKTGSTTLGGNWNLEYSHGEIGETLLADNLNVIDFKQLLDMESPTATVELEADFLSSTNNSTTLTVTFSEAPIGFSEDDLILSNGRISQGSYDDSNLTYTALFTADSNVDNTGGVELIGGSYEDAAGNSGGGSVDTADIDTKNPTSEITFNGVLLNSVNNTTTVTIEFSEDPVGFVEEDLIVSNGTLSDFSGQDTIWTAKFQANSNTTGVGTVQLPDSSYTDHIDFQNPGVGSVGNIAIDTLNPTANVALDAEDLSDGSNSTTLTITFSEVPVGFDPNSDLSVTGGTLGTGSFNDAELVWTATYTATDGIDVTGSVSLASASYTDAAGNDGFGDSDTVAIDTLNPVVTSVVRADSNYTNATAVSYIVTFSEDVTGVDVNGSDFSLVTSIADASILSVAGSHATYTVMVNTGNSGGSIGLALAATPTIQDVAGNDLIERNIAGSNEAYTVASTEVLLNDGNVTVTDIRDATADDITLSVAGSDLIISSASDSIAAGVGVTRVNASSVSVALADISGSNGVTVLSGDLDDTVTVEGLGRRLEIVGGTGTDVVQFQNVALGTNGGDLLIDAEGLTQDADASIDANNVTLGSLGSNFVLNAAMTTTGDLLVNTSGDLLQTQSGELLVGGVTTLNANNVVLDNSANDFQAAVHAYGSRLIFVDANDITFGDIDAEGAFFASALSSNVELGGLVSSSTANITAGGSITGTGLLSAATLTLDAQSGIGLIGTETTQAIQLATQNL